MTNIKLGAEENDASQNFLLVRGILINPLVLCIYIGIYTYLLELLSTLTSVYSFSPSDLPGSSITR